MTQAEIRASIRYHINEQSTDVGAWMPSTTIIDEFINSAVEHVVLDLIPIMPGQFLTTETITLVADQADYTLTAEFWQVYKIEKNVSSDTPREIEIIDPLEMQFHTTVGETEAEPKACYFMGDTLYFVPTPSAASTDYAKAYLVRPEVVTMVSGGPSYIPRVAHRMIVYKACEHAAIMQEIGGSPFGRLYDDRYKLVRRTWTARYQTKPRFVQTAQHERIIHDSRERAVYDHGWLD